MMTPLKFCICLLLSSLNILLVAGATATYDMVKLYAGPSFFDDWMFYGAPDNLNNGDANFLSAAAAKSENLAYVDETTGRAIIRVDNTSTVTDTNKRDTVRIASADTFSIGSLWVADMYHVPYGCSVWPGWTSTGIGPTWPQGGEIDTFEGVNMRDYNAMSLHTTEGCTQVNPVQTSTAIDSTDCNYLTNQNEGCIVRDSSGTYGPGFAQAGGGVFITEFAESGISIWFFTRTKVPTSLSSNSSSINTADFGKPVANWPNEGCNIDKFFIAQQLVLDITLCGDFARPTLNATCDPGAPNASGNQCYYNYVKGAPSLGIYNNAYFDVASVKVFSTSGKNTVIVGGGAGNISSSSSTSTTSTATGSAPAQTGTGNSGIKNRGSFMALAIAFASSSALMVFA
ncbi:glycoside hydrolase family 16 protein, partial [Mycena floridula]